MRRGVQRLRCEGGFTLVEMAITLVMVGILVAAFSSLFSGMLHSTSEVQDESVLQTEVRGAVDRMVTELTQAFVGDGSAPLLAMGAQSITFLTPDNQTPMHLRKVSYRLVGSTFQGAWVKSTSSGDPPWTVGVTPLQTAALPAWSTMVSSVLNDSVNHPVFRYLDSNGNVTASAVSVSQVAVSLTVVPRNGQGRRFTYSASATLRNPI
jgi:prepilin-type N-terminal cleavage/methylation domain-containing protein